MKKHKRKMKFYNFSTEKGTYVIRAYSYLNAHERMLKEYLGYFYYIGYTRRRTSTRIIRRFD